MTPLVSIIIPVYNGRRFLRQAVESVLKEGLPALEIIVVDDGSTDGSLEVVGDLPVRPIEILQNAGQAAAQNIGVANARGEFIAFLDSDDLLCPTSLKWRCEWLFRNTGEFLVAGRIGGIIDESGQRIGSYKTVLNPRYRTPPSYITEQYLRAGGEFPSQTWNFLFRKKVFQEIGLFDETLRCAHDNDFIYRMVRRFAIPFVNRPTVYYRMHLRNLSGKLIQNRFHFHQEVLAENLLVHLAHGISPRT